MIQFFFSSNMVTMLSYLIVNIKHVLSPRGISWENGVQIFLYFSFLVTKLGLCIITPGNLPWYVRA